MPRKLIDVRASQDATYARYTIVIPSGLFEIEKYNPTAEAGLLSESDKAVVPDVMAPTTIANGRIDQSPICLFRI